MTTYTTPTTTAELLAQYNGLPYGDTTAQPLAAAILAGDLSGKAPLKALRICSDDVTGLLVIQPIAAPKVKQVLPSVAALKFASDDALRPAMMCIYHQARSKSVVATNGHTLCMLPSAEVGETDLLLNPQTGKALAIGDTVGRGHYKSTITHKDTLRFPDYENVIPMSHPFAFTIPAPNVWRDKLAGIIKAERWIDSVLGIRARIIYDDTDVNGAVFLNAAFTLAAIDILLSTGTTRIQVSMSTPNRAVLFTDLDNPAKKCLVMPIMAPQGYGISSAVVDYPYVDLHDFTAVEQPAPELTPPTRKPRAKKPAAKPLRVLSAEEKQVLRQELKRYNAGTIEQQGRMKDHAKYSVALHVKTLGQQAMRQIGREFIADTLLWARVNRALLVSINATPVARLTTPDNTPLPAATAATLVELVECAAKIVGPTTPAVMDGSMGRNVTLQPTPFWYLSSGNRAVGHTTFTTRTEAIDIASHALYHGQDYHNGSMVVVECTKEFEWQHTPNRRVIWEDGEWREGCQPKRPTEKLRGRIFHHVATETNPALWAITAELVEAEYGPILRTLPTNPAMLNPEQYIFAGMGFEDMNPSRRIKVQVISFENETVRFSKNGGTPESLSAQQFVEAYDRFLMVHLVPTNPLVKPRANPFARYAIAGDTVKLLHNLGRVAVAWIYPTDGQPYLAVRHRHHYATVDTLPDLPIAYDELRRKGGESRARDGDALIALNALEIGCTGLCIAEFCSSHSLLMSGNYSRADIRRAILAKRLPKHKHYLNLLNKLTVN